MPQQRTVTRQAGPRRDPRPRPTDGLKSYNDVMNPKPGFRYVLAALEGELGVDYYEGVLGYSRVIFDEKNPKSTRLRAGRFKDGEPIISMSQMLLELPPKEAQELDEYGFNGVTGQALCDQLESQMLASGGVEAVNKTSRHFTQASMARRDSVDHEADTHSFLNEA